MKSRLHHIEIHNFKAFRDFSLNLEGRHLLVYGPNGSGKSSLYWALYTFLQSARKKTEDVAKYFDATNEQNLLNVYEQAAPNPALGEIALTLRDGNTGKDAIYKIAKRVHGTVKQSVVEKGDRASDFITYHFVFRFSDLRNSQAFDFWILFEREVLPFCRSLSGEDLHAEWLSIVENPPHKHKLVGGAIKKARDEYDQRLNEFNLKLAGVVSSIGDAAVEFYDDHFREGDPNFEFRVGIAKPASYNRVNKVVIPPVLKVEVKEAGKAVHRPHVFLNEAKLTQLALSVRFAASLVNLHESDLKLLVLDDLLVSLDMSNRMKVVEILLSDTFANYQKIILTHDLGFFREFRRTIGDSHEEWRFMSLAGDASKGISIRNEKSAIEKAEGYLNHHDLEEAAVWMRKAAEDSARRFRAMAEGKQPPPGKFHTLTENLRAARNNLRTRIPITLYEQVLNNIPEAHRGKLIRLNDDDIDADSSLDEETKRTIKAQRAKLSKFLNEKGWRHLGAIETLDAILKMTNRVLNPAAHWGEAPLYQAELDKALKLIARLEKVLK